MAAKARDLLQPERLRRLPAERIVASVHRRRLQGDRALAISVGRALTTTIPRSPKAHQLLVRALITPPYSIQDTLDAQVEAELMLGIYEDSAVQNLYIDALIARQTVAPEDGQRLVEAAAAFAMASPTSRFPAFRRFLVHLTSAGRPHEAAALAHFVAAQSDVSQYWTAAHEMALRRQDVEAAQEIEREYTDHPAFSDDEFLLMISQRESSRGDQRAAEQALLAMKPSFPRRHSLQLTGLLMAAGRHQEAVDHLDRTKHSLGAAEEQMIRLECAHLLGDAELVEELLEEVDALDDIRLLRLVRDIVTERRADAQEWLLERTETQWLPAVDSSLRAGLAMQAYFEIDAIDRCKAIMEDPTRSWRIGDIGRYVWLQILYVERRFPEALTEAAMLRGTLRHWEAEKLRARILFETGDDDGALKHRDSFDRQSGELDEVRYHALLHRAEYEAAFGAYVSRGDQTRLSSVFGSAAEFGPTLDVVPTRGVITQNGPGDEIMLAGLLPLLRERTAERLVVTCDPRLRSLLQRSFDEVDFVPVERPGMQRRAGLLKSGANRATGLLYDLLTAEAFEVMRTCDRVMLGRSLPMVSRLRDEIPLRYLVADTARCALEPSDRPRVGIVWRSEYTSVMRNFHYLQASDMAPIIELGIEPIVLQHDASAEELEALGPSIRVMEGLDLRSDFESAAALISQLDAVVGAGTTMLELAGALGVPAVLVHPTRFGSWRARGAQTGVGAGSHRAQSLGAEDPVLGNDYWHAGTVVVSPERWDERETYGALAADALRRMLGL